MSNSAAKSDKNIVEALKELDIDAIEQSNVAETEEEQKVIQQTYFVDRNKLITDYEEANLTAEQKLALAELEAKYGKNRLMTSYELSTDGKIDLYVFRVPTWGDRDKLNPISYKRLQDKVKELEDLGVDVPAEAATNPNSELYLRIQQKLMLETLLVYPDVSLDTLPIYLTDVLSTHLDNRASNVIVRNR